MKSPAIPIKKAVYATLGRSFTANSQTVNNYITPPQSPPNYYTWGDLTSYDDVGTKDKFIGSVFYDVVCVAKENIAYPSSVTLDAIANEVMTTLVTRGTNLVDADGNFSFISIKVNDLIEGESEIDNVLEMYKRVRLEIELQEV